MTIVVSPGCIALSPRSTGKITTPTNGRRRKSKNGARCRQQHRAKPGYRPIRRPDRCHALPAVIDVIHAESTPVSAILLVRPPHLLAAPSRSGRCAVFLQHSRPHFLARLRVGARHACRRFRVASSSTSIPGNFRDELDTLGVRRRLGGIPRGSHRACTERSGLGRLSAGHQPVESSYGGAENLFGDPSEQFDRSHASGRRREASQPHSAVAEKMPAAQPAPSGPRKSFFVRKARTQPRTLSQFMAQERP